MRAVIKISKASADAALPQQKRYFVWDMALPGFGLSVAPSGLKTFVLRYRAHYRYAQKRFITLGRLGPLTPDEARRRAKTILGHVADGGDPAADAMQEKFAAITLADACDRFIELHVKAKRKPNTIALYTHAIEAKIKPIFGHRNMVKIGKLEVVQFHSSMKEIPVMANRTIAALAALYSWAGKSGLIDEGFNPAARIDKYREVAKDRYLTMGEIRRLGDALVEAETVGFDYRFDDQKPTAKHGAKPGQRQTVHSPFSVAAIRLLILTGCRVSEILNLRWREVDVERGLLHLDDSKTGRKIVMLGDAALSLLADLPRVGEYVIAGNSPERPRTDLKRPWLAIKSKARLDGVRLHDLRHSYASVAAAAGLGLPVIGKLLGHSQARTTARYAHLADDPLRRASHLVSNQIAEALGAKYAEKSHNTENFGGGVNDETQ